MKEVMMVVKFVHGMFLELEFDTIIDFVSLKISIGFNVVVVRLPSSLSLNCCL